MTRIFVYGTLKPGGRYHEEYCGQYLVEARVAIAPGHLYDFPKLGYPAMTPGGGWVHGYLLTFSSDAVLAGLDWLEDYDPQGDPEKNEYQRQQTAIFTPAELSLGNAWIYLMTVERAQALGGVRVWTGKWQENASS